jgi:hypothetical protein
VCLSRRPIVRVRSSTPRRAEELGVDVDADVGCVSGTVRRVGTSCCRSPQVANAR